MSAVEDVQTFLQDEGLVDVEVGGETPWPSVRRRKNDAMGHQQVILTEDGGPPPEIAAEEGIGDTAQASPGVHVTVRGKPWDGDASAAKAQEIIDALHSRLGRQIGSREYIAVEALTPEPVFKGFDDRGRPEHTAAFRLTRALAAPAP